jgi:hypothetical protein
VSRDLEAPTVNTTGPLIAFLVQPDVGRIAVRITIRDTSLAGSEVLTTVVMNVATFCV